jgi:hypothetical protein
MRRGWSTVFVFLCGTAVRLMAAAPATGASTEPTTEPLVDPRPGLVAFYDALRHGDEAKAFGCWYDDAEGDDNRKQVEDLVHHLVTEMIASARFEDALRQTFPADYKKAQSDGGITPNTATLSGCQYAVYRRLAICSWGKDEDDGFPMVLDNSGMFQNQPAVWKLSMQQWHETNASSVGDPMLLSGWGAKAKDLTTKDLLAGKFKSADEMELGFLKHMNEIADAEDKAEKAATTQSKR